MRYEATKIVRVRAQQCFSMLVALGPPHPEQCGEYDQQQQEEGAGPVDPIWKTKSHCITKPSRTNTLNALEQALAYSEKKAQARRSRAVPDTLPVRRLLSAQRNRRRPAMTDIAPTERTKSAKRSARKQSGARLVRAQVLADHLTMSRANVRYFEERGLFTCNSGAGYDLDQCRDKYIAHLRSEFRKNPRAELEADFQKHNSPNRSWTPGLLRISPIHAGQQITELRCRDCHGAVGWAWP
jgi:hypothetical protein